MVKFTLNNFILFLIITGAPMLGFSKPNQQFAQVVVLDNDFKIINKITTDPMLNKFVQHWDSKKKLPSSSEPPGQYKIDVFQGKKNSTKSHRYLYNEKNGTLRLLTKSMTPEYQIEDLNSFNELLAIP